MQLYKQTGLDDAHWNARLITFDPRAVLDFVFTVSACVALVAQLIERAMRYSCR